MRTLMALAAVMLIPFLTPRPVRAQVCCGESVEYRAYDGVTDVRSGGPQVAAESIENTIYVNAYVNICGGKYVAVRMAVARQAG